MKLAEAISQHIVSRHFVPTWKRQQSQITLKAGDIHEELALKDRMPAVCDVLGSEKFQRMTSTKLISRGGPHHGASATLLIPS